MPGTLRTNYRTQQSSPQQAHDYVVERNHSFRRCRETLQKFTFYSENCVSFAKCRALACISLRFSERNLSNPNFSTAKLPNTEPYTIARRRAVSFFCPAPAR